MSLQTYNNNVDLYLLCEVLVLSAARSGFLRVGKNAMVKSVD